MEDEKYNIPVVWIGTILGDATTEDFEKYFKELGYRVKYEEEFIMQDGYYKDFHCTIFNLHIEDVGGFCVFRLMTDDMKWMDDFIDHHGLRIPLPILKKYAEPNVLKGLLEEEAEELS